MDESKSDNYFEEECKRRIAEFCALCDFRDGIKPDGSRAPCGKNREWYAHRNWCDLARIASYKVTTRITSTQVQTYIDEKPVTFQRKGKNAERNLIDAIERAKKGLPLQKYRN